MIRFRVLDNSDARWSIGPAYLNGQDDIPVAGEVSEEPGFVVGAPEAEGSIGISLLCDPDPEAEDRIGAVVLQTCLLPQRDAPYALSVELARHRIMLILTKLEAWALFDLPADDPAMASFMEAREHFADALVSQQAILDATDAGRAADAKAWKSLALAIRAGDRLTRIQAERQLAERFTGALYQHSLAQAQASPINEGRPATGVVKTPDTDGVVIEDQPTIGCTIRCDTSAAMQEVVAGTCDFINIPMRWIDMEPEEGKYAFSRADKWIEWAVRTAKIGVSAGPVIDFRPECVPEWLYIWENDYETLREIVYEHFRQLVIRYRRTVTRWTIVSGLHVNRGFRFSYEQMMDLTRLCTLTVRKLHPTARVQVELTSPWGEYVARAKRAIPPVLYAEMLTQMGINIDAFALRIEFGRRDRGGMARDLTSFSHLLDRYAQLDRPIAITSLGAPASQYSGENGEQAGAWRGGWTDQTQAEFLADAASVALSKPYVHSVCWQSLLDEAGGAASGLIAPDGTVRPAAKAMAALRAGLRREDASVAGAGR